MASDQTIEDPLTKGTGIIKSNSLYISEDFAYPVDYEYSMYVRFTVTGADNVLYKKLSTAPIRIQNMPMILNLHDGKHFIKIVRVTHFQKEENEPTLHIQATFKLLDNLEYVSAIQEQRVYWDDHVKNNEPI